MITSVNKSFTISCPHCGFNGIYEEYHGIIVCFYCGYRNGEQEALYKYRELMNIVDRKKIQKKKDNTVRPFMTGNVSNVKINESNKGTIDIINQIAYKQKATGRNRVI